MLDDIIKLGDDFPIRKSKKQKAAFRAAVQDYVGKLGYPVTEEKCSFGGRNIIIGNPEKAKYVVTAHYDTCAWMPVPNLVTPCNLLPFIGYQMFVVFLLFGICAVAYALLDLFLPDSILPFTVSYTLLWVLLVMIMIGPANHHNRNDNTSGVVSVLHMAENLPENLKDTVAFVLFDLEEAGLLGSSSYAKKHKKEVKNQIILNLDCVGDGDEIWMFPTGKAKKDKNLIENLQNITGDHGEKSVHLRLRGFAYYPSDQANFPKGVGIAALNRSWAGAYVGRIHTAKDLILESENVNLLCSCLIQLISSDTAQ